MHRAKQSASHHTYLSPYIIKGPGTWKNSKLSPYRLCWDVGPSEARCESSYIPSSLYKGPRAWKNSKLFPYRLCDFEKFRAPPLVQALGLRGLRRAKDRAKRGASRHIDFSSYIKTLRLGKIQCPPSILAVVFYITSGIWKSSDLHPQYMASTNCYSCNTIQHNWSTIH